MAPSRRKKKEDKNGVDGPVVKLKKGPWTAEEDRILTEYVREHGEGNWNVVQKNSGLSRCGKSCRLRWINHLRPDLRKGPLSPEEGAVIVELHAIFGNKWAKMVRFLQGRTDNEIKNFWNTRKKRLTRAKLASYPDNVQLQVLNEEQQQKTQILGEFDDGINPPYELLQENDYANSNHQMDSFHPADTLDQDFQSEIHALTDPFAARLPPLVHLSDEPEHGLGSPFFYKFTDNFAPSCSAISSSNDHALLCGNSFAFAPFDEHLDEPMEFFPSPIPFVSVDAYAQAHFPSSSVPSECVPLQNDGMLEAVIHQVLSNSRPQSTPGSHNFMFSKYDCPTVSDPLAAIPYESLPDPKSSGREMSPTEEFFRLDAFINDQAKLSEDVTEFHDADELNPQHCGEPTSFDGNVRLDSSLEFRIFDLSGQEKHENS